MIPASIVIPCFNSAWVIPNLVKHLVPFSDKDIEIVFVDDGSSDGSLELFQQSMPQAKCIRQSNSGVASARNTGARAALGEFIQFLDADDTLEPNKIEVQLSAASQLDLDIVYSDWRMVLVDGDRVTFEDVPCGEAPSEMVSALLSGWWGPPHNYLVRREAYWDIGGSDEQLINAEDFDLWVRLAINGKKFGYIAGVMANYYRYADVQSLSRVPRHQWWSYYEIAVDKAVEILRKSGQLNKQRSQAAAVQMHMIARNVYTIDKSWFNRLISKIYHMDPEFRPQGSTYYKVAAGLFGVHFAETLAVKFRR